MLTYYSTLAVMNKSAPPIVSVGPVLLLHTTQPFANFKPFTVIASEKFELAATVAVNTGTAVSLGKLVASWS
jgi:hypothetical protein